MIPVFAIWKQLGAVDTLIPLIIPAFLGGGAFNIFLMRQFFMTIPLELDDAAKIDGCSVIGIFWRIILPLSKPVVGTVAILSFLFHWNDFPGTTHLPQFHRQIYAGVGFTTLSGPVCDTMGIADGGFGHCAHPCLDYLLSGPTLFRTGDRL